MQTETGMTEAAVRSERSERSSAAGGGIVEGPEVVRRRQFTADYKLRILAELDQCAAAEQRAAVARREGLYSSTLFNWKAWRVRMQTGAQESQGLTKQGLLRQQLRKLERENEQLRLKLARAEGLIELQKKASALLADLNRLDANSRNS